MEFSLLEISAKVRFFAIYSPDIQYDVLSFAEVSSYRQCLGFVVEEAVGSQCRADVHDEVVQRAVP